MLTIITLTLWDSITTAVSGVTHSIAVVMGVYDKGVHDSEPPKLPGTMETSVVTRQFADVLTLWLAALSILSTTSYSFIGIMVLLTIHLHIVNHSWDLPILRSQRPCHLHTMNQAIPSSNCWVNQRYLEVEFSMGTWVLWNIFKTYILLDLQVVF